MALDRNNISSLVFSKSGGVVNVRPKPSTVPAPLFTISGNTSAGKTTGQYTDESDGRWYQVAIKPIGPVIYGYVRTDVVKFVADTASNPPANPDSMLQELIKGDKELLLKIKTVIKGYVALQKKGQNVTVYRDASKALFEKLLKRHKSLIESGYIKGETGSVSVAGIGRTPEMKMIFRTNDEMLAFGQLYKNYVDKPESKQFDDYLKNYLKNNGFSVNGIGAIPLIIVAGIFVAGVITSIAAYYFLKPHYDQYKNDFKIASELDAKIKAALTPAEYDRLLKDSQKQLDEGYNRGKNTGFFDAFGSMGKTVVLFGLGLFAATKLLK